MSQAYLASSGSGGGDVTAAVALTDNAIVRGDGGSKGVQDSGILIDDSDNVTGVNQLDIDSANGIDVNPGSDIDTDLVTVGVTGTPKVQWDESSNGFRFTKGVVIGLSGEGDLSHQINGTTVNSDFEIHAEASQDLGGITIHRHTDTALWGSHIVNLRSNGSHGAGTIVTNNDVVSRYLAAAYDGTDYNMMAEIRMEVDGVPGANDMPGRIVFLTSPDGSNTPVEGMRLSEDATLTLANALPVDSGGSGRGTATAYGVLCGGTTTTGAQQSIASVGTAAQVLTSNGAGALPTFQAAAGGGMTWNEETGTSATMAVGNGYIANNASLVTLTLPTTAAVGDLVAAVGKGAGLFKIAQNASEIIHFIDVDTTTGTGGSLTAIEQYNSIELICVVANERWVVRNSTGNYTVV